MRRLWFVNIDSMSHSQANSYMESLRKCVSSELSKNATTEDVNLFVASKMPNSVMVYDLDALPGAPKHSADSRAAIIISSSYVDFQNGQAMQEHVDRFTDEFQTKMRDGSYKMNVEPGFDLYVVPVPHDINVQVAQVSGWRDEHQMPPAQTYQRINREVRTGVGYLTKTHSLGFIPVARGGVVATQPDSVAFKGVNEGKSYTAFGHIHCEEYGRMSNPYDFYVNDSCVVFLPVEKSKFIIRNFTFHVETGIIVVEWCEDAPSNSVVEVVYATTDPRVNQKSDT